MNYTMISEKNRAPFEGLMPKNYWDNADVIIGAFDDLACGIIAVEVENDEPQLSWLYVSEEKRREGVATGMLKMLHYVLHMSDFDYLRCDYLEDEAGTLSAFFESNSFDVDSFESNVYRVSFSDVDQSLFEKEIKPVGFERLVSLKGLPSRAYHAMQETFAKMREADTEGVIPILKNRESYDENYSFFMMEGEKVAGCLLASTQDDTVLIEYIHILKSGCPLGMMSLLQGLFRVIQAKGNGNMEIIMNAVNPIVPSIVKKIAQDKQTVTGCAKEAILYL